jgi:succinate-semialdehyde dehydrogenase/glutarate-semialdehyde dehydrogenase
VPFVYPPLEQFIDGAWVSGSGARVQAVVNPADESELARYTVASHADLDRVIDSAERGFQVWRTWSPERRYDVLMRAAQTIRERADAIALILSTEGGKAVDEARREVLRGAALIEWDAAEGRRLYGRVLPAEPGMRLQMLREPAGVVAAFIAWNFPAGFVSRKVGGALAAGCAVVLKSTEETPGTCVALVQCFADAGVPPGALSLVIGEPGMIAERLIAAPAVRVISFTGSSAVGKVIGRLCAEHIKHCVLELGGHSPFIVCDDADMDAAVTAAIGGKFLNNAGQVCVAPTRFFIARARFGDFCDAFTAAARNVRVGVGAQAGTQMGPLIHGRRLEAIDGMVRSAVSHRARLLSGGERLRERGFFYAPTVLADVPDAATPMQDEPFGPIALLNPFDTLEEAIARANALRYGLAAYGFTESSRNAQRLTEGLDCGYLALNHSIAATIGAPFGGTKESGHGREGGPEGLQEFTNVKFVSHKVY